MPELKREQQANQDFLMREDENSLEVISKQDYNKNVGRKNSS